ncbi:hypothetical protein H9P43_004587 [Blastocladiella emersonii ATCC 22665]|nr:hypothetical protein H9P43_004587 [Blastocladiella emersonii ATCC 22665]
MTFFGKSSSGTSLDEKSLPMQPPPAYSYDEAVAIVSLHSSDTLRVCGIDSDRELEAITETIRSAWPRGIQKHKKYPADDAGVPRTKDGRPSTMAKYQLNGNPWWGQGEEAVPARVLVAALFRTLLRLGWRLAIAADTTKRLYDKDTWILLRAAPVTFDDDRDVWSISFNRWDRLRIIGARPEMAAVVRSAIDTYWRRGVAKVSDYCGAIEFKLNGNPWMSSDTNDAMSSRLMVAMILAKLRNHGYSVYASVDISRASEDQGETDSWVIVKSLDEK